MKKLTMYIVFFAMFVSLVLASILMQEDGTKIDLTDSYTKEARAASYVFFLSQANIRSEPVRIEDEHDGVSNSYGLVSEEYFDIDLLTVYTLSKPLDKRNGRFVGFSVEEILRTPEGRHFFPKGIKNDPDGIVWIQEEHVSYTTSQ